jgi:hypothetical protein
MSEPLISLAATDSAAPGAGLEHLLQLVPGLLLQAFRKHRASAEM